MGTLRERFEEKEEMGMLRERRFEEKEEMGTLRERWRREIEINKLLVSEKQKNKSTQKINFQCDY